MDKRCTIGMNGVRFLATHRDTSGGLPADAPVCGEARQCASNVENGVQSMLREHLEIVPCREGRDVRKNGFRQVEEVHYLRHASAGKPVFTGDVGLCEGVVCGEFPLPCEGHSNRVLRDPGSTDVNAGILNALDRVRDGMQNKGLCTPPWAWDAHDHER